MAKIVKSISELIGNTPLLEIAGYACYNKLEATLLAKLEMRNPGGSEKDRVAQEMIADAEKKGLLHAGGTIIEPTSGNTGIGLALMAGLCGYKLLLTMPETMSAERRSLLSAYGATLVLTPGAEGMKGAIAKAQELHAATPGSVILQQFDNPSNPAAHQRGTAEEIWRDTDGHIDIFVACVGTGGTISGIGAGLKAHNPTIRIVAVEPAGSPVLSGGKPGVHKIQGIGAGFIPRTYNPQVVDQIIQVSDTEALQASRLLARTESLLAGISSGAALHAATLLARLPEHTGKTIVVLLPDSGERYLSTGLFTPEAI